MSQYQNALLFIQGRFLSTTYPSMAFESIINRISDVDALWCVTFFTCFCFLLFHVSTGTQVYSTWSLPCFQNNILPKCCENSERRPQQRARAPGQKHTRWKPWHYRSEELQSTTLGSHNRISHFPSAVSTQLLKYYEAKLIPQSGIYERLYDSKRYWGAI